MVKRKKEYSRVGEALREYVAAPVDVAAAIDAAEVVEDFLPPPKDLVLREPTVKVTLNLSRRSVDFFKRAALAQGVPYQQYGPPYPRPVYRALRLRISRLPATCFF